MPMTIIEISVMAIMTVIVASVVAVSMIITTLRMAILVTMQTTLEMSEVAVVVAVMVASIIIITHAKDNNVIDVNDDASKINNISSVNDGVMSMITTQRTTPRVIASAVMMASIIMM